MLPAKKPCLTYERRRPELTPCYRILQNKLSTFIAERQAEGRPLPDYIIEEFEAYMRCGTCDSCGADMVAVCSIMERESIIRYLKHINIDYDPPERSPPRRLSQGEFDFDQSLVQQPAEEDNVIYLDS